MKKNKMLNNTINILLFSLFLSGGLIGCNSGGDGSSNGTSINVQPDNSNWVNYFSNYALGGQKNNLAIFQIQNVNGVPSKLAIYNSLGYTSATITPIQTLDLVKNINSSNIYNVIVKDSTGIPTAVGYIEQINNNNSLVVLLNLTSVLKKAFNNETATIQLAGKTMLSNIQNGTYYSHCLKLPLMNNQTKKNNDGNDLCSLNLQDGGQLTITDVNAKTLNQPVSMCGNSSNWYQNPINPYLFTINCITDNGLLSFDISSQPYESSIILNFFVNAEYNGNPSTTYVTTAFKASDLGSVSQEENFDYINLYMNNSYIAGTSIISQNALINNYCINNSSTQFCLLTQLEQEVNGSNRIIPSGGTITSYPLLIGSSSLNLFTDNLGYTYYSKQ